MRPGEVTILQLEEMKTKPVYLLLISLITEGLGCHPSEITRPDLNITLPDYDPGEMRLRKKRQISSVSSSMEDFFVSCIRQYTWRRNLDITTVVRFTIRETLWYQNTDKRFCARKDTANCWSNTLIRYLNPNSRLKKIAMSCIYRYERRGWQYMSSLHLWPPLRPAVYIGTRRRTTGKLALSENEVESRLRQVLPARSIPNIRSLINLVKEETICSPGICDCTGINIPPGETCGQFWYTRISSLTRLDRDSRKRISNVMNAVILNKLQENRSSRERLRRFLRFILNYFLALRLLATTTTIPPTTSSIPAITTKTPEQTTLHLTLLPTSSTPATTTTTTTTLVTTPNPCHDDCDGWRRYWAYV